LEFSFKGEKDNGKFDVNVALLPEWKVESESVRFSDMLQHLQHFVLPEGFLGRERERACISIEN
jgi:hypothetical protein